MESTAELAAQDPANIMLGKPTVAHGAEIHRLVSQCPPLDLNSTYAYLLLCEHYADTCVRAESGGETAGFVSAYRPPTRSDVLFVWQVAVAPAMRGRKLAARMLRELLRRDAVRGCRHIETTVAPSNMPSRRLFHSLARDLRAPVTERVMFGEEHFGSENHEQETLIRIGPIPGLQPSGGTQR